MIRAAVGTSLQGPQASTKPAVLSEVQTPADNLSLRALASNKKKRLDVSDLFGGQIPATFLHQRVLALITRCVLCGLRVLQHVVGQTVSMLASMQRYARWC
jgi:hypothetical protein